jgi:hypothetical protein
MANSLAWWWHAVAERVAETRGQADPLSASAEEYHARHLLQRTLADRADLRRRAPSSVLAAARYEMLLRLELRSLEELEQALRGRMIGTGAEDALAEAQAELAQLRTEVDWCRHLLAATGNGNGNGNGAPASNGGVPLHA